MLLLYNGICIRSLHVLLVRSDGAFFSNQNMRGLLYSNILLTGGSTLFPNFKERVYVAVIACFPSDAHTKVFFQGSLNALFSAFLLCLTWLVKWSCDAWPPRNMTCMCTRAKSTEMFLWVCWLRTLP